MTKQRRIPFALTLSSDDALRRARSVLEQRGYLWEQTGPEQAGAFQGGKPVKKDFSATKLRLGLRAERGELVLSRETSGIVGYAVNMGPLIQIRISREFKTVTESIERSLNTVS